jgi:hypothetical protein
MKEEQFHYRNKLMFPGKGLICWTISASVQLISNFGIEVAQIFAPWGTLLLLLAHSPENYPLLPLRHLLRGDKVDLKSKCL